MKTELPRPPVTRAEVLAFAEEMERKYQERLDEKIICGQSGHDFSKYLKICLECMYQGQHLYVCCMCLEKRLTADEMAGCCEGIAEEFTWDAESKSYYIVPPSRIYAKVRE